MSLDRNDLFTNLVLMAASDGKMTEEEVQYLSSRADRWGLTGEQIDAAVANARSEDAELVIPASKEDREAMVREMIRMMAVDGELHPEEKQLCAAAAVAMDLTADEFDAIVEKLLRGE